MAKVVLFVFLLLVLNKDETKNLVGLQPAEGSTISSTLETYSAGNCGENWCFIPASKYV